MDESYDASRFNDTLEVNWIEGESEREECECFPGDFLNSRTNIFHRKRQLRVAIGVSELSPLYPFRGMRPEVTAFRDEETLAGQLHPPLPRRRARFPRAISVSSASRGWSQKRAKRSSHALTSRSARVSTE